MVPKYGLADSAAILRASFQVAVYNLKRSSIVHHKSGLFAGKKKDI
jgi:hypothetical protein